MPQKSKGTNTFSSYLAPFYNAHYLYSCSLTIFWYICMMCFLTRCLTFDRKFIESFNMKISSNWNAVNCVPICTGFSKIIHSSKWQWYCCNKCLQNVQNNLAAQSIFYTYIIQNTSNHTLSVRNKKKITSANRAYEECATYLPQKVSQESLNVFNCVIHCTYMLIQ